MFGWEIQAFLTRDFISRIAFENGGLFFASDLPLDITYPAAFVINVAFLEGKKNQRHWVAIYIDPFKQGYYFDSFGLPPLDNKIKLFLKQVTCVWKYSTIAIQCVTSTKCGYFCLYFLFHRCRGWTFDQILQAFKRVSVLKNDKIVLTWFQNQNSSLAF